MSKEAWIAGGMLAWLAGGTFGYLHQDPASLPCYSGADSFFNHIVAGFLAVSGLKEAAHAVAGSAELPDEAESVKKAIIVGVAANCEQQASSQRATGPGRGGELRDILLASYRIIA